MEISGDMSMVGMNFQKMVQVMLQNKDEDSDGSLSFEEISIPKETFAKIDKNQDGLADPEELKAFFPMAEFDRIAADIIAERDVNGDGVLSMDEVKMPDELFGKMDQNADGKLDKNEIADFASKASQQGQKAGKKGGGKGGTDINPKGQYPVEKVIIGGNLIKHFGNLLLFSELRILIWNDFFGH